MCFFLKIVANALVCYSSGIPLRVVHRTSGEGGFRKLLAMGRSEFLRCGPLYFYGFKRQQLLIFLLMFDVVVDKPAPFSVSINVDIVQTRGCRT